MYHKHRNEVTLSIRSKSPKDAKDVCFQSSIKPNRTYEGESLYREFSEFCNRKPAEIESFIKLTEGFILDEQTRCGKGPGYDLRRARAKIRVI